MIANERFDAAVPVAHIRAGGTTLVDRDAAFAFAESEFRRGFNAGLGAAAPTPPTTLGSAGVRIGRTTERFFVLDETPLAERNRP